MKIVHRISFSPKRDRKTRKGFQNLGVKLKEAGDASVSLLNYFDISEDDLLWPKVKEIVTSAGLCPSTRTEFTKKEIASAEWVWVFSNFARGYPMPDLDAGYKNVSFSGQDECSTCGTGLEQIGPIHLKGEPKLGRNHFMTIFWTYSLFGRPEVFQIMSEKGITGVEPMVAIHHKRKTPLETIKQLWIPEVYRPCVVDENLERDPSNCGHIKYHIQTRGMMKIRKDILVGAPDFIRTDERFGVGHAASRLVLASRRFVQIYMQNNWKGLFLSPIELV